MLESHRIVKEYLKDKEVPYQRIFIARSDPAMNYGMISAILCNKIALQRLERLYDDTGVKIYPILGVGSPPFRGHLTPETVDNVLREYPNVQTFTIQSAFKYDNPVPSVITGINKLKSSKMEKGIGVDEGRCIAIVKKVYTEYQKLIEYIAPIINDLSIYIPRRRMRKLHIGLFGYSRSIGKVKLPRVISFCAACYSLGLPPEIIGLGSLSSEDIDYLKEVYVNYEFDLRKALLFFNNEIFNLLPEDVSTALKESLRRCGAFDVDLDHKALTSRIIKAVKEGDTSNLQNMIVEAAHARRFLG